MKDRHVVQFCPRMRLAGSFGDCHPILGEKVRETGCPGPFSLGEEALAGNKLLSDDKY